MLSDLNRRINTLAQWMFEAKHLVVFTGAGISTESGLPDFRGPDGIWTRQAKGLPTKPRDFSSVEPNAGHLAIVQLQKLGKLSFFISQSCDLFIVAGSSLVVMPAADMPRVAVQSGARLVIINQGETPLDRVAHLRFGERTGEVLPPAVDRLRELIKA